LVQLLSLIGIDQNIIRQIKGLTWVMIFLMIVPKNKKVQI
jgi:hypothetical protein